MFYLPPPGYSHARPILPTPGGTQMKLRPGLVIGAILAVALLTLFAGAAGATGTGSFSGAITPTACGPMHDVPVVADGTTIDAVAAEYVSANDIVLDLYSPSSTLLVHGDTLT